MIMKETRVNMSDLYEYDVTNNSLLYEDVLDNVFGAEDWTEDDALGKAVGFVDHTAVMSEIDGNKISFSPFSDRDDDSTQAMFELGKNVLRAIEFCVARVFHNFEEPSEDSLSTLDDEDVQYFEDECGMVVSICLDYEENEVTASFYMKQ